MTTAGRSGNTPRFKIPLISEGNSQAILSPVARVRTKLKGIGLIIQTTVQWRGNKAANRQHKKQHVVLFFVWLTGAHFYN
ncbi:hypothetical protein [Lonsdalea quercina]|uniref:hypothetical protein n=1 Tax=Lonsdalea quercina TaxID=71657 RepID=UPI003976E4E2